MREPWGEHEGAVQAPGPRLEGGASPDTLAINLRWLVRLRYGAFAGQSATILAVHFGMGITLPLLPLSITLALQLLSNVAISRWASRGRSGPKITEARGGEPSPSPSPGGSAGWPEGPGPREAHLAAIMALDVAVLGVLLYATGGPLNPFSSLYLVHIALAAVVLPPRLAWPLLALSLISFGALFFDHVPLDLGDTHAHGSEHVGLHLRGMWVAFGVTGVFVVYFVQRVERALAERDAELAQERIAKEKSEKLASLAALAAGAAHELSTPLATIAVIAKELERAIVQRADPSAEGIVADTRLIREQVERCRVILDQLASDAGQSSGEPIAEISTQALIDAALAELDPLVRARVQLDVRCPEERLLLPARAITQSLRALIRNARQASAEDTPVLVRARASDGAVHVEVEDRGSGMSPEQLARAGEPFFTTKEPGEGMGLGLFLTRTVLERLGGRLELASRPGAGTTATLVLPLRGATIRRVAEPGDGPYDSGRGAGRPQRAAEDT